MTTTIIAYTASIRFFFLGQNATYSAILEQNRMRLKDVRNSDDDE